MTMTVRELKNSALWADLDAYFTITSVVQRVELLVKLITYLKHPDIKTKREFWYKTASIERDLDDFYVRFSYSSRVHKEACDYIRCCFLLKTVLDERQLTILQLVPLLNTFEKLSWSYPYDL